MDTFEFNKNHIKNSNEDHENWDTSNQDSYTIAALMNELKETKQELVSAKLRIGERDKKINKMQLELNLSKLENMQLKEQLKNQNTELQKMKKLMEQKKKESENLMMKYIQIQEQNEQNYHSSQPENPECSQNITKTTHHYQNHRTNPRNYKTVPCRYFKRNACIKGDQCTYIHGAIKSTEKAPHQVQQIRRQHNRTMRDQQPPPQSRNRDIRNRSRNPDKLRGNHYDNNKTYHRH